MGKLGPLTSQALGRSPYDDVVQGEGEGDLRAPLQMYDERGRPVNPETKRINKDVIRSHNEVMQVIGVAEPDHEVPDLQAELRFKQQEDEDRIGQRLLGVGRILEIGGVWGVNGIRQRILIYRRYSTIPFYDLYRHELANESIGRSLFTGFPAFVASHALKQVAFTNRAVRHNTWAQFILYYIRLHLQIYVFLQRMGLMASTAPLPGLKYFVPFTASSPIPPPPPLTSFSFRGVLQYLAGATLSVVPVAGFLIYTKVRTVVARNVWLAIYSNIPKPANRRALQGRPPPSQDYLTQVQPSQDQAPPPPPPPPPPPAEASFTTASTESGSMFVEGEPRNGHDISRDEPTIRALEGQPPPDHAQLGAIRRQSTFSTRGDEYASDEEETEIVNATLISFDVEATDASDTPPGVWSAELRPNNAGDPRNSSTEEPIYADNALTRLPSVIATDVLTVACSYIIVAPYEAAALRVLAHSTRAQQGLPVSDLYDLIPWTSPWTSMWSMTAMTNFLGVEIVHLMIESELWGFMTLLAELYRGCSPEWSFFRVLREKLWEDDMLQDGTG